MSPRQKGVLARARARGKGVGKESPGGLICSLAIGGGSVCGATTTIQEINRLSITILSSMTDLPMTIDVSCHVRNGPKVGSLVSELARFSSLLTNCN